MVGTRATPASRPSLAALTGTIDSVVTTEAMFAADDEVIQFGRTRGRVIANGAPFDLPEVHRWTIRGSRAVAAHFAIDTEAMLAAIEAPATLTATGSRSGRPRG